MRTILIAAILTLSSTCHAQTGSDTLIWDWVVKQSYHESVVKICEYKKEEKIDLLYGTGIVFHTNKEKEVSGGYYGYILTAKHVIDALPAASSRIVYRNNERSQNPIIVASDKDADIIVLKAWVPKEIPATPISQKIPKFRETLDYAGLGGDSPLQKLRTISCHLDLAATDNFFYSSDSYPIPGDSGAPVFYEGKIAGIISGGMIWLEDIKIKKDEETTFVPTYPGRITCTKKIQKLIKSLNLK